MPTTARLVAALLLAALGWFTADLVKPYLPEAQPVGLFSPISALVGLGVGWIFTGKKLHGGEGSAVGIGLSSALLLVFWVAFIFSGYEMLQKALRKSYDGPTDAAVDTFAIILDQLKTAAQPDVIAAIVVGGVVAGALTRWTAARFR